MPGAKGIISIIDDHDDTRDAFSLLLESYGWETDLHASAAGFLESLDREQLPTVIVLDLDMLEKNSAENQKEISNLEANIPIIMLTLDSDFPHSKHATNNGATVLQKPVSGQALIKTIESLV